MVGLVPWQSFRKNGWFPTPHPYANGSANTRNIAGVRLVAHRKGATTDLTYAQVLDVAWCFGHIDGQRARRDGHSRYGRFTPRIARST